MSLKKHQDTILGAPSSKNPGRNLSNQKKYDDLSSIIQRAGEMELQSYM